MFGTLTLPIDAPAHSSKVVLNRASFRIVNTCWLVSTRNGFALPLRTFGSLHGYSSRLRYIELNPVRAGMVDDPADYLWSSYRAHAFGVQVRMWTPHPEYQALGPTRYLRLTAYRDLFESDLDKAFVDEVRNAANTGLVLGSERFRSEVEQLTGQRQRHLKRGPKPKAKIKH